MFHTRIHGRRKHCLIQMRGQLFKVQYLHETDHRHHLLEISGIFPDNRQAVMAPPAVQKRADV